jgi:dTDP-4-amino-4,6-dideoxygalactose transaminase
MKRIPRGVIYHKLGESVRYLASSIFMPLSRSEKVEQFEEVFAKYCERKHCVAFPFARTAIYFVLKNLNLPRGSEILLPPITIKGIVDVVLELGLVPVYVELDINTIGFELNDLRSKINGRVKAAVITTLFGLVPEMTELMKLFKTHGIFVIEDFSQCLNGFYNGKRIGTFGDVGIYSPSSIKMLDTLGGGLAITDDSEIYEGLLKSQKSLSPPNREFLVKKAFVNLTRNVATTQPVFSILTFPILQWIRWRNPESSLKQTGHRNKSRLSGLPSIWFCKYTSVQAEIGLARISNALADDKARVANAEFLKANVGSARFPTTTEKSGNVYWQLIVPVPDAIEAQEFFAKRGIDVATSSLELVCALKGYPNRIELPVAERVYRNGLFIPCFPDLSRADLERISATTREYLNGYGHQ